MSVVQWAQFFLSQWGLPFTFYVALQVLATANLRGTGRIISLIPALLMAIVLGLTIAGYMQHSNVWPLFLFIPSLFAIGFVGVVWFVYRSPSRGAAA
jgi:hypothetical protein